MSGLHLPVEPEGYYHVFHQYTVRHPHRDALIDELREKGIDSAAIYPIALHKQPLYENLGYGRDNLPVAEEAARHVLSLPVHPGLTDADVQAVADAVRAVATTKISS